MSASAPDTDDKEEIATDQQKLWFVELLEHEDQVCNNCFKLRYIADNRRPAEDYFRSVGTNAARKDVFCECGAGSGNNDRLITDDTIIGHLPEHARRELMGTVEREWCEQSPLPEHGVDISFARILRNIRDRLQEQEYTVDWETAKHRAARLKVQHPNRDRVIFIKTMHECSEPPAVEDEDERLTA